MINYSVSEASRNVHIVKCSYKKGWEQWFLLSSDWHHDHPDCQEDTLKEHLKEAARRDAGLIIVGDLVCGMQGKHDKRASKSAIKPEHNKNNYLDLLVESEAEFLNDYAEHLILYGRGNHEQTILKNKETDIVQRIVDRVREKSRHSNFYSGGYGGYIRFQFEHESGGSRQSILLKYRHSGGSLGEVTRGTLGVNRMAVAFPDADIIVTGDNHEKWMMEVTQERLTASGKIEKKEQLHIKLPTYKDEYGDGHSGWFVETDKAPRPIGAAWLRFFIDKNHKINYEVIWAK